MTKPLTPAPLTLALPKGRILKEALPLLARLGIVPEPDFADEDSRKLVFETSRADVRIIRVRSFDAATFVAFDLLALDDALQVLERRNPRQAQVVQCRYFGGMTVEETAEALGVSPRTVKTDWAFSRAWLAEQFSDVERPGADA